MDVRKFSIPEILFGQGSLQYAALCAYRMGGERVFLVSDTGLEKAGWVERVFSILRKEGLTWTYFNEINSNPRDYQVSEGAKRYLADGCDVVMAIGGGSPMDAAKGIAMVASNGGEVNDYEGANRIERPLPPMVFIPSTAGSGADISQFAIITDTRRKVKMSIISRTLVPNISITDPLLLTTKPTELVISSAIDALSHAIEAYVSTIASTLTEIQSLKAIDLILNYLPIAIQERSMDSMEKLSSAGTFAGMAFSNASLGLDHALAHSLGGKLDVAHGLIHPVLLPSVMRFNLPSCVEKMANIGEIIIGRRRSGAEATAQEGIERLEAFFAGFNISTRLRDIVSDCDVLPKICEMALNDTCLVTNPREADVDAMLDICKACW
ncbi:alcohol dehydrogenase [Desulfosarcina ovata subsp. sediminis]|uniref:Alcohol dehydrogenase n=1 Tax=Desulfosarcina ovata subsp. sediminis TaxID=885957 RepID=A0A5K7ZZV5_9BACT|nr:iron-containing alcohol dehydrogenase [Desulfosarcina ovata]BBO85728.1 alcohol dehydrogenase [Desulfosarcina ovata subsp. sediminis]